VPFALHYHFFVGTDQWLAASARTSRMMPVWIIVGLHWHVHQINYSSHWLNWSCLFLGWITAIDSLNLINRSFNRNIFTQSCLGTERFLGDDWKWHHNLTWFVMPWFQKWEIIVVELRIYTEFFFTGSQLSLLFQTGWESHLKWSQKKVSVKHSCVLHHPVGVTCTTMVKSFTRTSIRAPTSLVLNFCCC
jgi:hypothetical protein